MPVVWLEVREPERLKIEDYLLSKQHRCRGVPHNGRGLLNRRNTDNLLGRVLITSKMKDIKSNAQTHHYVWCAKEQKSRIVHTVFYSQVCLCSYPKTVSRDTSRSFYLCTAITHGSPVHPRTWLLDYLHFEKNMDSQMDRSGRVTLAPAKVKWWFRESAALRRAWTLTGAQATSL